jgi:hypothetical protein
MKRYLLTFFLALAILVTSLYYTQNLPNSIRNIWQRLHAQKTEPKQEVRNSIRKFLIKANKLASSSQDAAVNPGFLDEAIVNQQTLKQIAGIADQVGKDLDDGMYGDPDQIVYNMVFQFRQSLQAYHRFLTKPKEGPGFTVDARKNYLGRYHVKSKQILLGNDMLDKGEAYFLITLFHEYQHYLFNSMFGRYDKTDIAWRFYNEASAYLFSSLLGAYLPADSYKDNKYWVRDLKVRFRLTEDRPNRVLGDILDHLAKVREEEDLYGFLEPYVSGKVTKDELLDAVSEDFIVAEEFAEELKIISEDYFDEVE